MRGSLHCAADDETVRRFGRDDDYLVGGEKNNGRSPIRLCSGQALRGMTTKGGQQQQQQIPFGDDNQKDKN
jgi:hypothetical protein